MRVRPNSLVVGALAALASVIAVAAPAQAAGRGTTIQYIGTGTWSATTAGVSFSGSESGIPFGGVVSGHIEADSGELPPWPGCAPGSGTFTVSSGSATMTLVMAGDLCRAVSPAGYLVFMGWHDVTGYELRHCNGKKVTVGRGSFDLRPLADGTINWIIDGELRCAGR